MRVSKNHIGAAILAAVLCLPAIAPAALASEAYHAIGFVAHAIHPDNQIDDSGYYNLLMEPGQAQTIEVEVVNQLDEAIDVSITLSNATSNPNGLISYVPGDTRDESLLVGLTDIASIRTDLLQHGPKEDILLIEGNVLTIAPGRTIRVPIALQMPAESLAGQMLGGVTVSRIRPRSEAQETTLEIHSVYSYALAIQLQERIDHGIAPAFSLLSADIATVAGWDALVVNVYNPVPLVIAGAQLSIVVEDSAGSTPVLAHEVERFAMAPNSVMPYTIVFADGEPLPSGEYTVNVTLVYDGTPWSMRTTLAVP